MLPLKRDGGISQTEIKNPKSIIEPVHASPSAMANFNLYTCQRADRQSLQGPVPLVTEWYPPTRAMVV